MNSIFYSIELTYYSTSFLCAVIVKRSSFNVISTNSNDVHAYEQRCLPHDDSKNQPNNYLSILLMPLHLSITLNNTIHQLNVSLSQSNFQCYDY